VSRQGTGPESRCRICCCAVSEPAHRRNAAGELVEVCVATDHDGRVADATLASERAGWAVVFDGLGVSRDPSALGGGK
jgi:hypothetical protein